MSFNDFYQFTRLIFQNVSPAGYFFNVDPEEANQATNNSSNRGGEKWLEGKAFHSIKKKASSEEDKGQGGVQPITGRSCYEMWFLVHLKSAMVLFTTKDHFKATFSFPRFQQRLKTQLPLHHRQGTGSWRVRQKWRPTLSPLGETTGSLHQLKWGCRYLAPAARCSNFFKTGAEFLY